MRDGVSVSIPVLTLVRIGTRNDKLLTKSPVNKQIDSKVPNIIQLTPNQKKLTFGCLKENHPPPDICLESDYKRIRITRKHATIRRTNSGQFKIRDRSLYGTYLNYRRINHSVSLKSGDVICFGCINGFQIKPYEKISKNSSDLKFRVWIECNYPVDSLNDAVNVKLWCEFVARHAGSNELIKSLIHPLNTIIIAAISPGSRWIPIRFHFVECLHILAGVDKKLRVLESQENNDDGIKVSAPVLVSSLPLLLDVFQLFDFNKRSSAASNAPMDLRLMVHFSPSQRKQTACVDAVAAWLHDLLTESLCLYANSVAFPEYSSSAVTEVKNFLKTCKVANFTRNFKSLLAKVKEHVDLVRRKRDSIKSLFEQQAITALEVAFGQLDTPLLAYYVMHRKIRVRELSVLAERFKSEDMEHMKTEDAFADEKDAIQPRNTDAAAETLSPKKREKSKHVESDDSEESDVESDASYDIDDGKTVIHVSRSDKRSKKEKSDNVESDSEDEDFDLDAALAGDEAEKDLNQSDDEDELKEFRIDDFEDSDEEEEGRKGESDSDRLRRLMKEDPDLAGLSEEESEIDDQEELMDVDMDDFSSEDAGDVEMEAPPVKVHRIDVGGKRKPVITSSGDKKGKKQNGTVNKPQQKQSLEKTSNGGGVNGRKKSGKKNRKRPRKDVK
nr:nucleolar complex protein 2 [Hymenolepis microstoma]